MNSPITVVVSDTHVGSTVAVCPPDFEGLEGKRPPQSNNQKFLWHHWQAAEKWVKSIVGKDRYDLLCNGDLIEGVHHHTTQVWSNDPGDHIAAAVQLLNPLAQAAKHIRFVTGTEAHVGNREHALAYRFGEKQAYDQLNFVSTTGTRVRSVHHMGTSARLGLYGTGLSVALAEHQSQAARAGHPIPQVVIAGHRHTYGLYEDGRAMMVSCPPWQLLTRFGHKVATAAVPAIGLFLLDWRGVPANSLPVVRRYLATVGVAQ